MAFTFRPYNKSHDLQKMQTATAEWIAAAGFSGYLHTADIALRLHNAMRRYYPSEIVRLWEDADGTLLGWGMVYPRWNSYEALISPDYRGGELENQLLEWCESETFAWMVREGRPDAPISLDVFSDDFARITALEKRGYVRGDQQHVIASRYLDDPIPDTPLPHGFSIRLLKGSGEVDKLIAAQNACFGWSWTLEEYLRVMQSPAGQACEPLIIVAPDGRFAAFCYLMQDTHNRLGMLEDVGTHPDFQRKGLARALLYDGMKRLKSAGMNSLLIPYLATNDPASRLYEAIGFRVQYRHLTYTKSYRQG
ncbi:MAG: GNAT family N-acetyltransferase [Anaerolineae bacterium]|nr:GNAT family N-acetyltransferase [Anaerolineae bacterium]